MQLRQHIARVLVEHGVRQLFGVLGDANLFMVQTLVRDHDVAYHSAAHEAGAVMMADGYARVTGKLGVASVTHGPGLTNTLTALTEAVRNGTPLLLMCGDTPPTNRFHLQNIDQRELVKAVGAHYDEVRSPETAAVDTALAIRRAIHEKRPVVLGLRSDLVTVTAPERVSAPPARMPDPPVAVPSAADLDRALGILVSARRPVVLAGRGAVSAGARHALLQLASILGAPVATTLLAKGWFAGHPADLGICGTLSDDHAIEVIGKADCVVSFGAALTPHTTAGGDLFANAAIIQCANTAQAFGRFSTPDAVLLGDAAATAEAMVALLESAGTAPSRHLEHLMASAIPTPAVDPRTTTRPGVLDPLAATRQLDELLPPARTVVFDAGRFMGIPLRTITVSDPSAFVFTCNFGSIGLGTGNAVGAGVGRPDQPVVLFVGDGGFMMGGLAEFSSAVRHHVDLIAVVYDDGAYGAEFIQLERAGEPTALTMFGWPDFAVVAASLGGTGITVTAPADMNRVAHAIKTRDRPLLIHLKFHPADIPPIH
ncbi:Acetolactate synthase [Mycolicibacterium rhodesiae JS60]|nr:Acetolactate synthase [Mycolicibacterium rhodesiae JS60]